MNGNCHTSLLLESDELGSSSQWIPNSGGADPHRDRLRLSLFLEWIGRCILVLSERTAAFTRLVHPGIARVEGTHLIGVEV